MTISKLQGGKGPFPPPLTIDPNILSGGRHWYSWHLKKNLWEFFLTFSKKHFFSIFFSQFHFSQKLFFWKFTKNHEQNFLVQNFKKKQFFIFLSECFGEPQKRFLGILGCQKVVFFVRNMKENFKVFERMPLILCLFA